MTASVPPAVPPPPPTGMSPDASRNQPNKSSRTRLILAVGTVAVLAVAILLVAVFATGRTGGDTGDGVKPTKDHSISAALGGKQEASFEIVDGAETIVVRCDDTGEDLYRVSTPKDGKLVPTATTDGDTTRLSLPKSGANGDANADVLLNKNVKWHLKMAGGGMNQKIECGAGKIASLELGRGASTIEVTLPKPQGTLETVLSGGAGALKVHLMQGPPVQVKVGAGAGAGTVSIDGQVRKDVKAGTEVTPDAWTKASDRYTVSAVAGLASLTIDRV